MKTAIPFHLSRSRYRKCNDEDIKRIYKLIASLSYSAELLEELRGTRFESPSLKNKVKICYEGLLHYTDKFLTPDQTASKDQQWEVADQAVQSLELMDNMLDLVFKIAPEKTANFEKYIKIGLDLYK
jgi:hypothetical protein